jgi:hypothetical protein
MVAVTMTNIDRFGRPTCSGWGPARRCGASVHPGYTRCPSCDRVYTPEQLRLALAHPQNASFRGLHGETKGGAA